MRRPNFVLLEKTRYQIGRECKALFGQYSMEYYSMNRSLVLFFNTSQNLQLQKNPPKWTLFLQYCNPLYQMNSP
jgi:hypothetical protein